MRWIGLAVLVSSVVLGPAHAQQRSPEVSGLALPLSLSATLAWAGEHGCSQSFASTEASATLEVSAERSGAARIHLVGEHSTRMGPSPGRYMAGDRDFTRTAERHDATWTGWAVEGADGSLAITVDRAEIAEVRFVGEGTLPLPAPVASASTGTFACHLERVDVLPAEPVAAELGRPLPLARCAWTSDPPAAFERYTEGAFVMGRAPGVRDTTRQPAWGATAHEVRLVP